LLHFGLLPIVTQTATVRAASLGFEIDSQDPDEIINDIRKHVRTLLAMPNNELTERSAAVQSYAAAHHTRPAYAASFTRLLDHLAL
jgi:hypothetical protein